MVLEDGATKNNGHRGGEVAREKKGGRRRCGVLPTRECDQGCLKIWSRADSSNDLIDDGAGLASVC